MISKNAAPGFASHPNHTVEIQPYDGDIKIEIDGDVIAKIRGALVLQESKYAPAYYLPKSAMPESMLEASNHSTYCPFKGDASYYHLIHNGKRHENAVWSYKKPFDEAIAIKDYIAIYPNVAKVEPA